MKIIDSDALDLAGIIRPGDTVTWGQGCAEPRTLTEAMVAQRADIGRFRAFIGANFSRTFDPSHADYIHFVGPGAVGSLRALAKAGAIDIIPFHITSADRLIDEGHLKIDVVLVQVAPPDEHGHYSLGLISDWIRAAVRRARIVIAEVNQQVPRTPCTEPLTDDDIDIRIDTDRTLIQLPPSNPGDIDRAIARHALAYVPDRAVMQVGIGAVPDALVAQLTGHRDLGIHSGMIGDSVVDLIQSGVITNAHKEISPGISITGVLVGTDKLYRFCDRNPQICLAPVSQTYDVAVAGAVSRLISLNSAVEVDITGQVNAEAIGETYFGTVGGQLDFGRAAVRSRGGRSIIALPSATADGKSRIVAKLSGPVTTPRSDVDLIVTEHGAADLRGMPISERVKAMIAITDPSSREALERAAHVAGARR